MLAGPDMQCVLAGQVTKNELWLVMLVSEVHYLPWVFP